MRIVKKGIWLTLGGLALLIAIIWALKQNRRTEHINLESIEVEPSDSTYTRALSQNSLSDSAAGIQISFKRASTYTSPISWLPGSSGEKFYHKIQIQDLVISAECSGGNLTVLEPKDFLHLYTCAATSTFLRAELLQMPVDSEEQEIRRLLDTLCPSAGPFEQTYTWIKQLATFGKLEPIAQEQIAAIQDFKPLVTEPQMHFWGSISHFIYSYNHGRVSDWAKEPLRYVVFFVKYPYAKCSKFHVDLILEGGTQLHGEYSGKL